MLRSNHVHQEAITAQASFDEDAFLTESENVWKRIAAKFKDDPLDTLSDHESFSQEVAELEQKIGNWQRKRREDFILEKQGLENVLRTVGDDRPILKTNYDPYMSPEDNIKSLYQELSEHLQVVLTQCEQRYHQLHSEVIYAERVQQITGTLPAESVNANLARVYKLKEEIASQFLSDGKARLERLSRDILELMKSLDEMTGVVRTFITRQPPEGEGERNLLQVIQESVTDSTRGVDFTEVILKLVANNPNFQLEQVMADLQNLFKKNQVIIRVQTRR